MSIESTIIDLIEGRLKNVFLQAVLYVLSLFYQNILFFRHFLYDIGFLSSYTAKCPVVSVGNIVAGGTGKTPFVRKLTEELSEGCGSVAILSRGYRSQAEHGFVLASSGKGPLVSVAICGDEPYWLASKVNASIWVGKNRAWNARQASLTGAKILILEDGFQHRKMKRDLDIVLLDATNLFGYGYFLPRGYLRDSPKRLKEADFVVVTRLQEGFSEEEILEAIRPFTKAPIIGFAASYLLSPSVKGKKVGAFCGIGKPDLFYQALSLEGVELVKTLSLSDHEAPSLKLLSSFALECKNLGADYLVCTEKDEVKLSEISPLALPVEVLKMDLSCIWNQNIWKEMIRSIKNKTKKNNRGAAL